MIRTLIHEKRRASSGKVEEKEFIVHSTSWRYAKLGKVILTYVAYSDELKFEKGTPKSLPLKRIKSITRKSRKPASHTEMEKKVVSHAIRHIAFLIQTGDQDDFKSALTKKTIEVFEELWVSLAGEIL